MPSARAFLRLRVLAESADVAESGHAFYGVLDCAVLGWLGTKRPTIYT